MKIKYHRSHQVQPVQYESITFGASLEVDLSEDSADEDYRGVTLKQARQMLNEDMDTFLAIDIKRAVESDDQDTMHTYAYYEIN